MIGAFLIPFFEVFTKFNSQNCCVPKWVNVTHCHKILSNKQRHFWDTSIITIRRSNLTLSIIKLIIWLKNGPKNYQKLFFEKKGLSKTLSISAKGLSNYQTFILEMNLSKIFSDPPYHIGEIFLCAYFVF